MTRKSAMCKAALHDGCSISGRMIGSNGKKFKCRCACHVVVKPTPRRMRDES